MAPPDERRGGTSGTLAARWLSPGALPLASFAPAVVIILGVVVAVIMAALGVGQLRRTSDDGAAEKAHVLGSALVERLSVMPEEDREQAIERVARRTGTDLILAWQRGDLIVDTSVGGLPTLPVSAMLVQGKGFTETSTGRAAYDAEPLRAPQAHLALITLVHAPATPPGARDLLMAVAFLAVVLIEIAAYAAYRFAKSARDDVDFVRARIEEMAQAAQDPVGEEVPVRTFDQVGVVTAAFNVLLARFAAADRAYRHDLEQADLLDRARARFLAALSHELRTPLNAVLGFADILLSEVDGPLSPSAREDIEVIRSSGEHLRGLIDDILDLSAIEMGSLRLERKSVDVYEVAAQVVREAQPLALARELRVFVSGEPGANAFADPKRVRQILANLVSNAVKFTPQGSVEVHVERVDERVRIEVRDTGPGIAEGERAAIFEEYRQTGEIASRRKGTGLGLAIARRLVAMHDGTISLDSQVAKGTTFRVELPMSTIEPSAPPPRVELPSFEGLA